MEKRVVDEASLSGVADAIRAKTGKTENLVFPAEFETGVDEVFAAGEKSEYDRFWDAFQQNGNRIGYTYAFAGTGWNDETFNPKYPITIEQINSGNNLFLYSYITDTKVPIVVSKGAVLTNAFANSNIKTIRKLTFDETVTPANNTFGSATALTTLIMDGVIGQTINLQWSTKLSKDSIASVIDALSASASGKSVTFSKTAVDNAFTAEEWTTLANTKKNWTINLV